MTLVSIKTKLYEAGQAGYAVPLFDVVDMYSVEGTFEALEEKRAPTILGVYTMFLNLPGAEALAAYIRTRAQSTSVPVSLMLDHGESVEHCLKALAFGFTDVMYDGSQLPFTENIENTRRVVQAAHAQGAAAEAELGHVGSGEEYQAFGAKRQGFTDPDLVETFVQETGVDFLAIAFGNAHGLYKGTPQIDLGLVREIRQRVDIPLVMHGGTGLEDAQYRQVIASGIAKINIATIIMNSATQKMVQASQTEKPSMFAITGALQQAYREGCGYFFEVFGAAGRG
jgi:ketose-bisphosphate aldolase